MTRPPPRISAPSDSRIPDPRPRTPDLGPRTPDPGPRTPDPRPQTPDPGPRTPDPRVILIADRFTNDGVARKTIEAVEAGIRWVQLRDHQADVDTFTVSARNLVKQIQHEAPSTIISINRRLEVAVELGLSFHTSSRGPSISEAKKLTGTDVWVGFSCHSINESEEAVREGADYIFFSPVFPTSSKPGHPGTGLEALALCCKAVAPVPVYALGGITPDRVNACMNNGVQGVAVISGILKSNTIPETVASYTVETSRRDVSMDNRLIV